LQSYGEVTALPPPKKNVIVTVLLFSQLNNNVRFYCAALTLGININPKILSIFDIKWILVKM
jgi:hypothetical protein